MAQQKENLNQNQRKITLKTPINLNVERSIRLKSWFAIIISLTISLSLSSLITAYLDNFIDVGKFEVYVHMLMILIISTIIIIAFIQLIILKPLNKVVEATKKAAEGDLTTVVEHHSKDEIGQLAAAFNMMIENLRNLLQKSNETSLQVASYSEELKYRVEQNSLVIEQISAAIQNVVLGADQQEQSAHQLNQSAHEISKGMENASKAIQSVADASNTASKKADLGIKIVTETIEQMNLVQETVKNISGIIHALGDKSNDIGNIVNVITEIANQTNLLALNAAIEAARAGEHGKGFAVVADEVRKLAEQSGEAAGNIHDLIKEIQSETKNAVDSMNSGINTVEKGIFMVNETGKSFREIVNDIQEISKQSQEVSIIVEQVNQSLQNMAKMIENITVITEQTAENTQQVAASIEEQTATMDEIASSSEILNKNAKDLEADIHRFKVH